MSVDIGVNDKNLSTRIELIYSKHSTRIIIVCVKYVLCFNIILYINIFIDCVFTEVLMYLFSYLKKL